MGTAWAVRPAAGPWKGPGRQPPGFDPRLRGHPSVVQRRSGLLFLAALLLATAAAGGAVGVFLYGQLRAAEAAAAQAAARSAELEVAAHALGAEVESLERRERALTQVVDELSIKQRARDAALAERATTRDLLQALLQPLTRRGDVSFQETPDALEVFFTERVLFVAGTARLSSTGARLLRQMGDGLLDTRFRIEVNGRGPSLLTGSLEEGAELARLAAERAAWVSTFLVRRGGLPEDRVTAGVYGPVRRRPGEPAAIRRSSIAVRLVAPLADIDRPAAAAFSVPLPTARP